MTLTKLKGQCEGSSITPRNCCVEERKDSSTTVAIPQIPAGMLSKEMWEKQGDPPLLQGSVTPMSLLELGH